MKKNTIKIILSIFLLSALLFPLNAKAVSSDTNVGGSVIGTGCPPFCPSSGGGSRSEITDTTPPANIFGFTARSGDTKIYFNWQNPSDPDFAGVRIIRSDQKYPSGPWSFDFIVYDSSGVSAIDNNLINGKIYYYMAFAYDVSGNYASGVALFAIPYVEVSEEISQPTEGGFIDGTEEIIKEIPVPAGAKELLLQEGIKFDFIQGGIRQTVMKGEEIIIKAGTEFIIELDKNLLPENADKVIFIIFTPDPISYALTFDKESGEYRATISSLEKAGEYSFEVQALNKNNNIVGFYIGKIKAEEAAEVPGEGVVVLKTWYGAIVNWFVNLYKTIADFFKNLYLYIKENI